MFGSRRSTIADLQWFSTPENRYLLTDAAKMLAVETESPPAVYQLFRLTHQSLRTHWWGTADKHQPFIHYSGGKVAQVTAVHCLDVMH